MNKAKSGQVEGEQTQIYFLFSFYILYTLLLLWKIWMMEKYHVDRSLDCKIQSVQRKVFRRLIKGWLLDS